MWSTVLTLKKIQYAIVKYKENHWIVPFENLKPELFGHFWKKKKQNQTKTKNY